ncbi:MAG: hypothetical protein Q7T20_01820 [Saprospiraceae bacterium]|nr:hypothetical protein [Saprospiraceae bacterium]
MKQINYLCLALIILTSRIIAQDMPTKGHIYSSVIGNNSEPVIYNSVNLNSYELLTTNIQVSKEENLQKMVFAPLKLVDYSQVGFLRETRINIAQKNGVSTFGLGLGFDNSSPYSKRGDMKISSAFKDFPPLPVQGKDEKDYIYEIRKHKYYYSMDSVYAETYKKLLTNSVKITAGYNISLFEIIGGDKVDADNDTIIDNYHVVESNNYSLGITYAFSLKRAVSLTLHHSLKRGSQNEDERLVSYSGWSFSYAQQICILNKRYERTPDYLKSLFIPSITGGASIEFQNATKNKTYVKNGITETLVITPFLEFKINPKNQFRIGIPIKKYSGMTNETALGPFIQWTLQIAKID